MSENEFDAQRDHADQERDDLVLTGEEIELPGEDSDASAIIGQSSEPIHTGEIESVAIGGLTGRVPTAAPLKPTIEDKISTGELPVVSTPEGDLPVVASADKADSTPEREQASSAEKTTEEFAEEQHEDSAPVTESAAESGNEADAAQPQADTAQPQADAENSSPEQEQPPAEESTDEHTPAEETISTEAIPASSIEEREHPEAADKQADTTDDPSASLDTSAHAEHAADEAKQEDAEDTQTTLTPVMTPAQAAAALTDTTEKRADEAQTTNEEKVASVGGAATEASTHSLPSRRSMIFGDDELRAPSIPALAVPEEKETSTTRAPREDEAETTVAAAFTQPTTQLPTQDSQTSYAFEDQDAAEDPAEDATEEFRPRRRSLLGEGDEDRDAATLAAIASTAAHGDKVGASPSLDDQLFSAAPEVTEMPSRTGAHWLSFLLFLLLVPVGWYLAADAGARMTLADAAPMYTGVASIVALGELLGAVVISAILFNVARRSSLGAWLMGIVSLLVGLPWVMAPGITAASVLTALTALTNTGTLGANLAHHLQASGYSGRFALLGVTLMGLAYVSHSARRTGRDEEALRTSIEAVNPAGAFYSKRARKKAAKDTGRK